MTPIRLIREHLVVLPEVLDLEAIAARLEHHKITFSIDNNFSSDAGDRWQVKMWKNGCSSDGPDAEAVSPTLRGALLKALDITAIP